MANLLMLLGAPGKNRTCGQRIRNPLLYPLSYRGALLELILFQYVTLLLFFRFFVDGIVENSYTNFCIATSLFPDLVEALDLVVSWKNREE